jgi:hypothetical protein
MVSSQTQDKDQLAAALSAKYAEFQPKLVQLCQNLNLEALEVKFAPSSSNGVPDIQFYSNGQAIAATVAQQLNSEIKPQLEKVWSDLAQTSKVFQAKDFRGLSFGVDASTISTASTASTASTPSAASLYCVWCLACNYLCCGDTAARRNACCTRACS